jgi:hypothetical protein
MVSDDGVAQVAHMLCHPVMLLHHGDLLTPKSGHWQARGCGDATVFEIQENISNKII